MLDENDTSDPTPQGQDVPREPGTDGDQPVTSTPDGTDQVDSADSPELAVGTTVRTTRRRSAGRPAGPPAALNTDIFSAPVPATSATHDDEPVARAKRPAQQRASKPRVKAHGPDVAADIPAEVEPDNDSTPVEAKVPAAIAPPASGLMFQAPPVELAPPKQAKTPDDDVEPEHVSPDSETDADQDIESDDTPKRRRRSRGGRRRRRSDSEQSESESEENEEPVADSNDDVDEDENSDDSDAGSSSSRRRRRRARAGEGADTSPDDPENTVVKVREGRTAEDEITGVTGSTRLEAKRQRRREGREAGRRRAPIISEAEFLARRESVNREMVVRQLEDYTQIAVLEDNVLVEHYVARESQVSIIGNVYLGKVQNVLPSMEAAFIDIGAGRNAVLYAGEVDWTNISGGKQRKIEDALTPGQAVLVQVTKDPIGQKGARLTSQISVPGRFLVYVPGGGTSGISRKLPDGERSRLKGLLKDVLPENAGVIVRTAAEGATEEQLTRDVSALTARWEDIERKVAGGKAPELLYAEPDLTIKVIRDLFNEDFGSLTVEGDDAWDMVSGYTSHVAPDLADRVSQWKSEDGKDLFSARRIDEQIKKALDRKVHLPSGGSLVIDRTEAMTVVDVNTGRFTGTGGNLEETVTKNNLEAAEEIVRQLRLRDIGGIVVIDFIDMVLESNRDLVLRRLVECLGRDRTRHQVAEVTSLGLVQMTRKRIGTGLLESFSHECDHCKGRGVVIADEPIEPKRDEPRRGRRGGKPNQQRQRNQSSGQQPVSEKSTDKPKAPESNDSGSLVESTSVESTSSGDQVAEVVEPVVAQSEEGQPGVPDPVEAEAVATEPVTAEPVVPQPADEQADGEQADGVVVEPSPTEPKVVQPRRPRKRASRPAAAPSVPAEIVTHDLENPASAEVANAAAVQPELFESGVTAGQSEPVLTDEGSAP